MMEVTFWGVRGSIPSPGPATVRYGGNTACVSLRLGNGQLIILDCGTGARNLGISLLAGPFGKGKGSATLLLSHAHWDHIQGFPFFGPFYVPGNTFTVYGGSRSERLLEDVLERQMAAQFFPVQSFRNMGARIEMRTFPENRDVRVGGATVRALANPHGTTPALAFRIEAEGKSLAYAGDAGYGSEGPTQAAVDLYRGVDLLIHDSTFTPEDRAQRLDRGLSSLQEAVDCAARAAVNKLVLFHYDQDYSDHEVDQLVARGRRALAERAAIGIEVIGAAEGLTLTL
jgi:phosphoribosyl 1,2-cyclic phosphodiesterase